jgi:hypothetical protein
MGKKAESPVEAELLRRVPHKYRFAYELSERDETKYRRWAARLRPLALETCPECLFALEDVLQGDEPIACPNCRTTVSRPINAWAWGSRWLDVRWSRVVAMGAGLIAGAMLCSALGIHHLSGDLRAGFGMAFFLYVPGLAILLLVTVPISTVIWMKAGNPTTPLAFLVPTAVANLLLQLMVYAVVLFVLVGVFS